MFNQKLKEYKERQQEINSKLQTLDVADEDYYITVNTVLSLAQRALEIFESSEVSEKRQLLNFLLQNLELKGKNLSYKLKTPFDTVLSANKCSSMLPLLNTFRTVDWENIVNDLKILETSIFVAIIILVILM